MKISRILRVTIPLLVIIFLALILVPRTYKVPPKTFREGTQFWNLPTGSKIAYTHISAKGLKKPFPIIFLQGGPGGPIYNSNIKLLSNLADDGFDVYLYDQIGCGFSGRLKNIEDYSVNRHKKDLEEIVKQLGAQKIILIAQSWGAILATFYIADNCDKVDRVILTGPGPLFPVNYELEKISPPDSLHLREPLYTNRQGRIETYNIRARVVEAVAKTFNYKLASDSEMDDFSTILNYRMGKSTVCDTSFKDVMENGSGYYSMIKTMQSLNNVTDQRPKLKECKVPILIMRGQCDGIEWGYITEYLKVFSNSKLVIIPDAGHSIGKEQPVRYIETAREFLTKEL